MPPFTTATAGVRLVPVAATTLPVAAVWKTLVKDFEPPTTTTFCAPALVTLTWIVCVPGVGLARPHNSARSFVPLVAAPRKVMACCGPPASLPHVTVPAVAPPPLRSSDTPTTRYGFFAELTVWVQVTMIGFAVDAVAGALFDAASKTTCADEDMANASVKIANAPGARVTCFISISLFTYRTNCHSTAAAAATRRRRREKFVRARRTHPRVLANSTRPKMSPAAKA